MSHTQKQQTKKQSGNPGSPHLVAIHSITYEVISQYVGLKPSLNLGTWKMGKPLVRNAP